MVKASSTFSSTQLLPDTLKKRRELLREAAKGHLEMEAAFLISASGELQSHFVSFLDLRQVVTSSYTKLIARVFIIAGHVLGLWSIWYFG